MPLKSNFRGSLLWSLSAGYLLIPNLLFYYYWTSYWVSIVGIGLLVYLFIDLLSNISLPAQSSLSGKDVIYLGTLATLITLFSGIAGICWQFSDYWVHNTKFYDLFIHEWPLRIPGSGPVSSYYYGYYLVPILISKMLGYLSESAIFIWTFLGIFLGISWLYLIFNKKILYVFFCFCVINISYTFKEIIKYFGIQLYPTGSEGYPLFSLSEQVQYVPNQVIPTLIIGGMLIFSLKNKIQFENIIFIIALSFWWAVFASLTSGMLLAILILRQWVLSRKLPDWPIILKKIFLPVLCCFPVLLLFESHSELPPSGFIWNFRSDWLNLSIEYSLNILLNLLLFLLVYRITKRPSFNLPDFPFYISILFVLIIPLYRIGVQNDFMHRGLMPFILLIGIYLLEPLSYELSYIRIIQYTKKPFLNFFLFLLLISSTYLTIRGVERASKYNIVTSKIYPANGAFIPIPYDAFPTVYDLLKEKWSLGEAKQYMGREGSLYEVYIGKEAVRTGMVGSGLQVRQ